MQILTFTFHNGTVDVHCLYMTLCICTVSWSELSTLCQKYHWIILPDVSAQMFVVIFINWYSCWSSMFSLIIYEL